MSETFEEEFVQRIVRNFLDIQILRLIQVKPMWGYAILKKMKEMFGIKIRHGVLYPLLNSLEAKGFLKGRKVVKKGRVRKVYEITSGGSQIIESYHNVLKQQLEGAHLQTEESQNTPRPQERM